MADNSALLEIRVHGVHGTSPQSMLGVEAGDVGQVAGDGLTGIYRVKSGKIPLRKLPKNAAVEAYSWGALTSGVRGFFGWLRRAAWLLLLPFALLNISYWARPELDWRSRRFDSNVHANARFGAALTRIAGLVITCIVVLVPLTIGVDLVAWQCYRNGDAGCPVLPGWLGFLTNEHFSTAPPRLALGALLPLLLLLLLFLLSRTSLARYEQCKEPTPIHDKLVEKQSKDVKNDRDTLVLRHTRMWSGDARTRRLQRLHLIFALAVVVCYTGIPVLNAPFIDEPAKSSGWTWFVVLGVIDAFVLVLAAFAIYLTSRAHEDDLESPDDQPAKPKSRVAGTVLLITLALTVAHLGVLEFAPFASDVDVDGASTLLGRNVWFVSMFVLLTVLFVMLFVLGRMITDVKRTLAIGAATLIVFVFASSHFWPGWVAATAALVLVCGGAWLGHWQWRQKHDESAWKGAGASILMTGCMSITLLFTTAAVTATANYLNGDEQSVSDLGTKYQEVDADVTARSSLTSTGDATIRNATVIVGTTGSITVLSGEVEVTTLRPINLQGDVAPALGDTSGKGLTLMLDPGSSSLVAVRSSCLYRSELAAEIAGRCSLEQPAFAASGSLAAPADRTIVVGTPRHRAEISVREDPQRPLTLPQVLVWAPMLQLLWLIGIIFIAGLCVRQLYRSLGEPVNRQLEADKIRARDRRDCKSARMTAAFSHRGERFVAMLGVVTAPAALALVLGSETGKAPWYLLSDDGTGTFASILKGISDAGLWTALLTSVVIIGAASRMRTSESTRKGVGILWDLTTFWPRAAHPFAPPCYAERVVPELLTRVSWVVGSDEDPKPYRVVVSAHSQGSTVAVAALSRLSDGALERVRLVTYGSQIRAWYGRVFPGVFGHRAIGYQPTTGVPRFKDPYPDACQKAKTRAQGDESDTTDPCADVIRAEEVEPAPVVGSLLARLEPGDPESPRWVNLFRRSDPLGFHVFGDNDSQHDRFTREVPKAIAGDPGPSVKGHGGYQHSPEYIQLVDGWVKELSPPLVGPQASIVNGTFLPPP